MSRWNSPGEREGALVPESSGIHDSISCINQPAHI